MAQDNAAQAIKDLKKNLEDADMRVKALTTDIPAYFQKLTAAFSAAAKNANVSIDQIFDYIAQKRGAVAAQKIKLQFDTARAKSDIDEILQALGSKNKSVTLFGGETLTGTKAMKDRLLELKKEYEALAAQSKKTVAQMTDDLLNTVNATVGKRNSYSPLTRQRVKDEKEVQKIQEDVTRTLQRRKELEEQMAKYSPDSKSKRLRSMREEWEQVNRQAQEYISKLGSLGTAGGRSLKGLETAGLFTNADKAQLEAEREYIKLMRERYALQEKSARLTANLASAKLAGKSSASFEYDTHQQLIANQSKIDALTQQINNRKIQLTAEGNRRLEEMELTHQNNMTNIALQGEKSRVSIEQRKTNKADSEAKRDKAREEQELKLAERIVKKRIDLEQKRAEIENREKIRQQKGKTVSTGVQQAEQAQIEALTKRINQLTDALSRLEQKQQGVREKARWNMQSYADYASAKTQERFNKELDKTGKYLDRNTDRMRSFLSAVRRVGSALGIYFSARGLIQFGKKLVETRGEFEMQFVAMKQIIGDVDAATKIWGQTMQQALKSPFKAMQLVTYTKQLAAYRIETEKLFDTTKRLADVSAGLGVDMGRLILAYGQVKAANFLRASEIRQFTEAGVNILGELSKYFTEIEGRAVSTAQVMERVTKRMVTFADVEEIFKRMTDEGGQFFEMQEVQADTVKGQIAKLHDAYDQMLNTIGKANQGTLRNFIGALNRIVRNWDKFASVLKTVIGIFVTFKVAQTTAAIQMIRAGKAADAEALGISGLTAKLINLVAVEKSTTEATLTLSTALKQLNSSKGGWIGVAVSAALTAAMAIYDYYQRATKLSKELNEITSQTQMRARKSTTDYEQMAEKIRDVNTSENERKETLSKLKQMYEDILPSRMLEIEYITKEGNAYDDAKESIKAYYEEKRKQESLDKVYEKYGNYVEKAREDLIEVYKRVYGYANVDLKDSDINAVVDELIRQYENGELVLSNYTETFEKLIQLQSGVDLTDKLTWNDDNGAVFYFERVISALDTLDDKIEEVTGSTAEFAGKQKELLQTNVFGEAEKNLSDSIAALSKDGFLKSFNDELESQIVNYEDFARLAYETFKETFKEEYETNPTFFDDQFEKELEKRLGNLGIELKENWEKNGEVIKHSVVDNQKTINNEIEKLAEQTSISDKKILRQFQVDTSVEFDKWIQNQLSKIDLYKTELLRIQKGLTSDMTDEHIAMLQTLEPFLPLWEEYLKGLTPTKKTGGSGRKTHENASKLISLIKEMRSEYDKLSKSAYGYAKSEEKVREAYKDSVKEILGKAGITDYDFTTNEGMIKALEKVKSYATKLGKDAAAEVQKYIDQLETEIEINAQVKIKEDFGRQIEKMFSDYELSLNFESMGIPEDLAKDLFGIDTSSLDEISSYLQRFATEHAEDWNEDINKIYADALKKISDKEQEQYKKDVSDLFKRVKSSAAEMKVVIEQACEDINFAQNLFDPNYVDQATKDIKAKIKQNLEEINRLTPSEGKAEGIAAQQIARLEAENKILENRVKRLTQMYGNISAEQYTDLVRSTIEWENERTQKISMEQLKKMPEYLEAMGRTAGWSNVKLREMLDYLKNLISVSGSDMSLEDYKTVVNQIDKIQEQIESNDYPFGREGFAKVAQMLEEQTEADEQMKQLEEERNRLQEESKRLNEELVGLQERLNALKAENHEENKDEIREVEDQIEENLRSQNQNANQQRKVAAGIQTITKGNMKTMVIIDAIIHAVNDTVQDLYKSLQKIEVILQDYSIDTEHGSWAKWAKGMETFAKASQDATNGWEAFKKGDVAGIMLEVVNGIVDIWHGINEIVNQKQVDTIYFNEEKIEDLKRAYERLEKQIAKTWDTVSYMQNYNEMMNNLHEQIEALNQQLVAEEEKKNTDKEAVKDYQDKIQDAEDELENLKQKQIEVFGGIGEEGYRDAAQGFVDAWKSAFLETGDGLQGLQDHFDEFLNEWFVKQATMRVAGKMLEPLFRDIDNAVDKYSGGGTSVMMSELAKIRERFGIIAPQLSDTLDELSGLWGIGGEGGLSGLAAGIQGMTEEQANVLEAYWNSVRGYTANIDMNVSRIAQILGAGGDNANPMLRQMTFIAENTSTIIELLNTVSYNGGDGAGIRVYSY